MRLRLLHVLTLPAVALALCQATARGGEFTLMHWLRPDKVSAPVAMGWAAPSCAGPVGLSAVPLGPTVGYGCTGCQGCTGGLAYVQAAAPSSYYVSSYGGCTGGMVPAIAAAPAVQQTFTLNASPAVYQVAAPVQYVQAVAPQPTYAVAAAAPSCGAAAATVLPSGPVVQSLQRTQQVLQKLQPSAAAAPEASYPMSNEELTAHVQALTRAVEQLATVSARHEAALAKPPPPKLPEE